MKEANVAHQTPCHNPSNEWGSIIISRVEVEVDEASAAVKRKVHYRLREQDGTSTRSRTADRCFVESVTPVYVPEEASGTSTDSGAAMSNFQRHWDDASIQARATAKWIATALGVALAALVGTAPLTNLSQRYIPGDSYLLAGSALFLIGLTLFLVLRVLVPNITGFDELLTKSKFEHLRDRAQARNGVMLPTGICTLEELAGRCDLEAQTLNALADKIRAICAREPDSENRTRKLEALKQAQQTRGHWLEVLTTNIMQWTSIAAYESVRRAARLARTLGLIFGIGGTAAIILAFALMQPKLEPATMQSYHLMLEPSSAELTEAVKQIGKDCKDFKGVVTEAKYDHGQQLTVLVEHTATCHGGIVSLPAVNLEEAKEDDLSLEKAKKDD
jgi:hypothetical protein